MAKQPDKRRYKLIDVYAFLRNRPRCRQQFSECVARVRERNPSPDFLVVKEFAPGERRCVIWKLKKSPLTYRGAWQFRAAEVTS